MSPAYSLAYLPLWALAGSKHATVTMALLLRLGLANAVLTWLRREHGWGPALVAALWCAAVPCVVAPQVGVSLATTLALVVAVTAVGKGRGVWRTALVVVVGIWLSLLRPELSVLSPLVLGVAAVVWWRGRSQPAQGAATHRNGFVVAVAMLTLGLGGFGLSYAGGHEEDPHRSEWALRAAYHKTGDYDATFPGATTLGQAVRANPSAMSRHVLANVPRLGRQLHAVLGLGPLRPPALAWIAVALAVALAVVGLWRLRGRRAASWGGAPGMTLVFGAGALTLLAALLIEPVPRYLAPLLLILAPLLAGGVAALLARLPRGVQRWRRALLAVALLGPPLLLARPAVRKPPHTPMPVREILSHATEVPAPATLHGHAAHSFAAYLGHQGWTVEETYTCPDAGFIDAARPDYLVYSDVTCDQPFEDWSARVPALDAYQCRASSPLVGCRLRVNP